MSDVSLADGLTRCQNTFIIAANGISNWTVLVSLLSDFASQMSLDWTLLSIYYFLSSFSWIKGISVSRGQGLFNFITS